MLSGSEYHQRDEVRSKCLIRGRRKHRSIPNERTIVCPIRGSFGDQAAALRYAGVVSGNSPFRSTLETMVATADRRCRSIRALRIADAIGTDRTLNLD